MKRVIIAALCLLLVSTISSGQKRVRTVEWKLLEVLNDGREIYIQNKKKLTKSRTLKVWIKIEKFRPDRLGAKDARNEGGANSSQTARGITIMSLYEFNCKEDMYRVNDEIWYVREQAFPQDRKEAWSNAIPGSIGETILKAACKK